MDERLLTPTKITAWLDCDHHLALTRRREDGTLQLESQGFGSFARLLMDKGQAHEVACLGAYRDDGKSVFEVPQRRTGERFADWVARIGDPLADGHDVIYQMPFIHDGVRGIADFLVRTDAGYEPVDAKLARVAAKPGHVLQLCFYAEAIEALTGQCPEHLHVWLGSGRHETVRHDEVRPYWNRLRTQLAPLLADDAIDNDTRAEPCSHCAFCEFAGLCEDDWRSADSLVYVAGIRGTDIDALAADGVETLAALAGCADPVTDLAPARQERIVRQAALQVIARADEEAAPPFELIDPGDDPTWGHGFAAMPEPDDGDVFLDFEGHPFWQADAGLFFLFGYIARDDAGDWVYHAIWAHDREDEAAAVRRLIEELEQRRAEHPSMHVYHYNHTERSALERLAIEHGVAEATLVGLVETGLFVDLLAVARNAVQVGTESYGLKYLERLTDFERGHDIDAGAGAVVEYEAWMATADAACLDRIAAYNDDDVRATQALRDWLVEHRPGDLPWRPAVLEAEESPLDLDELVERLHDHGPDTTEHLLGDLLGYWLREWRAYVAPKLAKAAQDTDTLLDDPEVLAGLHCVGQFERTGKHGRTITPGMRFTLPRQEIGDGFFNEHRTVKVLYGTEDGPTCFAEVIRLDPDAGELEMAWNTRSQEFGTIPTAAMFDDYVPPRPKPEALNEIARQVLGDEGAGEPNEVALALLRRDLPRFTPGHGPADGLFHNGIEAMADWVCHLDRSVLAIQGPPGTGKTYRGAQIVRALVRAGKRVGIMAMSHHAIDNLLTEVVEVMTSEGDMNLLCAARRGREPEEGGLTNVTYVGGNGPCADDGYNVVAGTSWLFSGKDMKSCPVDVLIIDEAGQLALADAVVATRSARNLVLLGDPLQLAQVTQASHPGASGASVLGHLLGDDLTMPPERGVFLDETRRMHPDVCAFISERIYEGRLTSEASCAVQSTEFGTGLRWLRVDHEGCSTGSIEEADAVQAQISELLGTTWVNREGVEAPIAAADVMVVAPYNDQVSLLRARLDDDPVTRGVSVGTVDKFQGRQAPVVFFTMTTSSAADMPRTGDFLFSRNRLNVAISRAQCLAYLVCTEALLDSRARTVEEMRLLGSLCAFVEHC